jgi:hypothetical protein
MNDTLKLESERLERSWMRHDAGMLRDYLVASVEDPRINLQSILSRHFLVQAVAGEKWAALQQQEYRFSAAVNWLAALATRVGNREDLDEVLYALRQGADNSEGLEIPPFLSQTFRALPATTDGLAIPNYIESLLLRTTFKDGRPDLDPASLDTFQELWSQALIRPAKDASRSSNRPAVQPTIIGFSEPMAWPRHSSIPASISARKTSIMPGPCFRARVSGRGMCLKSARNRKAISSVSLTICSSTFRLKALRQRSANFAG